MKLQGSFLGCLTFLISAGFCLRVLVWGEIMQHGARLFRLRKTLGLSADDMAAALGFTGAHRKSKLHKMEINKRDISPACLDKIERMEREPGINPPKNERLGNEQ